MELDEITQIVFYDESGNKLLDKAEGEITSGLLLNKVMEVQDEEKRKEYVNEFNNVSVKISDLKNTLNELIEKLNNTEN